MGEEVDDLICRRALGPEDKLAALAVRREVFVDEQGVSEAEEYDGLNDTADHYVVTDGDRVIATTRVRFPTATSAKLERMAVLKPFRRKGVGTRILTSILDDLRTRQVELVVLHAQVQARDFYRSCGFEETGEPFHEAGIEHVKMRLVL